MGRFKRLWIVLTCVALVGIVGAWYATRKGAPDVVLQTVAVERGELLASIGATGTCEPEEVVDVGAQVEGMIEYFGKDPHNPGRTIDYNSKVDEGTVLAHIDDSLYAADVDNAQAALEQANANVVRAQADLQQKQASLFQAQRDWERAQKIGPGDALAENDYDQYQSNFLQAKANVAVDEASILQTQKAVVQAQAALTRAQKNLGYCTITSPVKGVVIDRRVNIGETVVSSLNTPSLFLIAKDLTKMQVWASVNEADIGNIHPGQRVLFTIDAYPGQQFVGSVGLVRLNATMTQNVVTYTVEVNTDNSDGRLLPYMTANLQFEVRDEKDVLLAPNAALRWYPPQMELVAVAYRNFVDDSSEDASGPTTQAGNGRSGHGGGHGARENGQSPKRATSGPTLKRGLIWVKEGQYVRPISVRVGLTDGFNTRIEGPDVHEGMELVVADMRPGDVTSAAQSNPFMPQFGRRR